MTARLISKLVLVFASKPHKPGSMCRVRTANAWQSFTRKVAMLLVGKFRGLAPGFFAVALLLLDAFARRADMAVSGRKEISDLR